MFPPSVQCFSSLIPTLHLSLLKKKQQLANECSFATRVELDLKPAAIVTVLAGEIIHVFMLFYCCLL